MNILKDLMIVEKLYGHDPKMLRNKLYENFNEYVNVENPTGTGQGVYFIEDFYIGKSSELKTRIVSHLADALTTSITLKIGVSINYEKILKLKKVLSKRKLNVVILDDDCSNEDLYIDGYYLCNPLTNKVGISSTKKSIKAKNILQNAVNSAFLCRRACSAPP